MPQQEDNQEMIPEQEIEEASNDEDFGERKPEEHINMRESERRESLERLAEKYSNQMRMHDDIPENHEGDVPINVEMTKRTAIITSLALEDMLHGLENEEQRLEATISHPEHTDNIDNAKERLEKIRTRIEAIRNNCIETMRPIEDNLIEEDLKK